MDVLWETLAFVAKAFVVFVTVSGCAVVIASRVRSGRRDGDEGHLTIKRINDQLRERFEQLRVAMLPPQSQRKAAKEARKRLAEGDETPRPNLFVLDFKGDVLATGVEALREEVTAVLGVATPQDEVLVRLESGGGAIHSYGLAASQLARFKARGIRLTAAVDRIAASGGYMMACVADRIVAAPFAILGSIGVVAPLPNVHRLLQRVGVDYEDATAGEFKRTVTVLGAPSERGRAKFQEELEDSHALFKEFVGRHRPQLDVEAVATGEHWFGERAVELGLLDELSTSDDYLLRRLDEAHVFEVSFERPRSVRDRLALGVSAVVDALGEGLGRIAAPR